MVTHNSTYPTRPQQGTLRDIGPYRGLLAAGCPPALITDLTRIRALLEAPDAQVLAAGRNRNVRVSLGQGGDAQDVVVKAFGRESAGKNRLDMRRGTKARRTWLAAEHLARAGVGTPEPLAYMDLWHGGRLKESYFISTFQADVVSFKDELIRLFREDPECSKLMDLLQTVATAVAAMHRCGLAHNDLGNQNILLSRSGDATWERVQFIDLNRARIESVLSLRQRARDLSRLWLPSDLLRVFLEMYWGDTPPPEALLEAETRYRRRYAVHAATRKWRHPLRTWQRRKRQAPEWYPDPRELSIWDERSAQPIAIYRSRDRKRLYAGSWLMAPVMAVLRSFVPVWREYRSLLGTCYGSPVRMHGRIGLAIDPRAESWSREQALLGELGHLPLFVRFYHHESRDRQDFRVKAVRDLTAAGHGVSVALVQDRAAIRDPASWSAFVTRTLDALGDVVDSVEVGHALNRVKWGLWGFDDLRRFYEATATAVAPHPGLRLTGPAVIDFEYPFVLAALRAAAGHLHFQALSHHLYVDRRGAPENRQGRFAALEKMALARAIARHGEACDDELIVSEVNWPIEGTGVYSPVGAPYVSPGPRHKDPSVSEMDYATFMIRYYAIALCSGMVSRVYWWRLVAQGFGLVDDRDPDDWRRRPAFAALRTFMGILGDSTFERRITAGQGIDEDVHVLAFMTPAEKVIYLAWVNGDPREVALPQPCLSVTDMVGEAAAGTGKTVRVTGAPCYIHVSQTPR